MDPLSAFGLATNILTFVEFSCKLVADSRAIYKSAEGASDNSRALETIATEITQRNSQLVSSTAYPKELQVLCTECNKVANDLLAAIKKLRVRGKNRGWESFKAALRETWGQSKMNSLEERLQQLQRQLVVQMQFIMLDKQSSVSQEIARMSQVNEKLDMETNHRLASLETNVLQVLSALKSHPEDFVEQSETLATTAGDYSKEAKITDWNQRLIESLYYPRFQSRHDAISIAHAKTFEWILSDTQVEKERPRKFVEWLRFRNGTFFVQGKAGSGKSTLMKFLWHHDSTREHLKAWSGSQRLIMARYFFWAAGDELQKSEEGLMRALLFEILRACPDLISGIKKDLSASGALTQQLDTQIWTRSMLLKVFDVLMNQEFEAKFCFFIDGLDEFKGDTPALIELIQKLVSYPGIKICVSGRPWAAFKHAFGEDDNAEWHIKLEDLTKDDIRQFVDDKLNADVQFNRLRGADVGYSDIAEEVMLRAQGVFLWVVLVVRSLLEGANYYDDIADMRRRLDAIPDDLDDFFRDMLDDIPVFYRSQSAMTFKIALAAESSLPLAIHAYADEIYRDPEYAVSAPIEQLEYSVLQEWNAQFPNRLDARCKGLLEIVKCEDSPNEYHIYEIDFLHRTVRDFLHNSQEITRIFDNDLNDGFNVYVLLCHAYLADLKSPWRLGNGPITSLRSFMHYAKQLQTSLGDTRRIANVFDEAKRVFPGPDFESGLSFDELAVQYDLESYITQQLFGSTRGEQSVDGHEKSNLLDRAIFGGISLIRQDVHEDLNPESLNPTIVNCLLKNGANPNYFSPGTRKLSVWERFIKSYVRGMVML